MSNIKIKKIKKKHNTTYDPGNQKKKGLKKKSRQRSQEVKIIIIIIINVLKGANAQESKQKKKKKDKKKKPRQLDEISAMSNFFVYPSNSSHHVFSPFWRDKF